MSIEFKLPDVAEGVTSVDVADMRVKEGDVIEAGAIICEVETDKAVAEITCPHAGRISKVLIRTGESIKVGQLMLLIEATDEAPAIPAKPLPAPTTTPSPSKVAPAPPVASAPEAASGGIVEFRLPEVSEGVTKVDVASVNVKVGDMITNNAVVCEVETDKAVAEITCPHAGTITAVHVKPGATIAIGELLITLAATSSVAASVAKSPVSSRAATAVATAPVAAIARVTSSAEAASGSKAGASTKSDGPPAAAGPALA